MASYNETNDIVGGHGYGGFGGFGGGGGWLIGALVVFWLIFKDGHKGHESARPHYPDESNWELEAHMQGQFSRTRDIVRKEGEETRHLITNNLIQDLRDKLTEKNALITKLENEGFTTALFGKMMHEIGEIKCSMVKRPPSYAATVMPDMHLVEPGRGRCDW